MAMGMGLRSFWGAMHILGTSGCWGVYALVVLTPGHQQGSERVQVPPDAILWFLNLAVFNATVKTQFQKNQMLNIFFF